MKRLSILIADRTPEFAAQLARWLRAHDTTCVQSTTEAMSAASLLHFDVVVSATTGDDVSGIDAIRSLKRRQPWTRVLAVVGEMEEDRQQRAFNRALWAGADAAVKRSVDERRFLLALRACWHDARPHREAAGSRTSFTLSRV
jgi:CheY-like chemotaxis protein